uniref:membrane progestin receptor delta isoform X3 n=1 Tax=Doryrhamphus excisus TaxID=161450 RepID=UPI0025AEB04A|nr:membrane progestin receptor delta isoform X3 [Doryrhamphus excisus]
MPVQRSLLALGKCLACLEFMLFPLWRGLGAGVGGGWSQGWGRCLRWEPPAQVEGARIPLSEYPVWLVICRGGRARLSEVCQRGKGAIRLPTEMLSIKLPPLFDIHQIPKVFREDGIMSGYRHPQSSALDCVLSSFQMNNETVNIWTHFLPTCTMSQESRHICYFFDYTALSLYSLGSAISYGSYVMPDSWVNGWLHQHFVPIAVGNTLFCTSLSCYSRFLEVHSPKKSKMLRTSAFVVPFIFDSMPIFYRLLLCCGGICSPSEAVPSHCYQVSFALLTCFLFTSHLPERLAPGRFDYFGHSHQLFHVSAVVATHFQMQAVITDMTSRRAWLVAHGAAPSLLGTMGVLVVSLVLNLGIIAIFSAQLLWRPRRAPPGADKER